MHAKNFRGVRLTRDANGPTFSATNAYPALVNGFAMVQPISHDPYPTGTIQLEQVDQNPQIGIPDGPDILIVRGLTGSVDWDRVSSFFGGVGQIRIPSTTGQWYTFTVGQSTPYILSATNEVLILQTPFSNTGSAAPYPANYIAYPFTGSTAIAGCDIQFGNEVLPFHQPIALPSAVVIDLRYCSPNVVFLAGGTIGNTGTTYLPQYRHQLLAACEPGPGRLSGRGALYFCLLRSRRRHRRPARSSSPRPLAAIRRIPPARRNAWPQPST